MCIVTSSAVCAKSHADRIHFMKFNASVPVTRAVQAIAMVQPKAMRVKTAFRLPKILEKVLNMPITYHLVTPAGFEPSVCSLKGNHPDR